MGRNIDDLADTSTNDIRTSGDKFYNQFLDDRPRAEWAPYLDVTARDIRADVLIGETLLSSDNFGRELGTYYRQGLERSGGQYSDLPDILAESIEDTQLGTLSYRLNELVYELAHDTNRLEDTQSAVEAFVEKLLTREIGSETNLRLPGAGGTVADIAIELFENDTIASNIDLLLSEIDANAGAGLLAMLDEPQLMIPLWDHQRDALLAWQDHDYQGFVDMATATGKTVLGLGAIALQYGELHPGDQGSFKSPPRKERDDSRKDDILVVAHNDLILEQWRREFDRHLNIPHERTSGGDDIILSWGRIHFRTPQALLNEFRIDYDLVLLDEAHHYTTGSKWGQLLEEFDDAVLALSGSVDDAGTDSQTIEDRLRNGIGPRLKRYTIAEARANGVIPSFDWEVRYASAGSADTDLERSSRRAESAFKTFRSRIDQGKLDINTDRRLRTYQDLRTFSHTTAGGALKGEDDGFRELVTRLFSRRTTRWNQSPSLTAIIDLVKEHITAEKVVVLADSNTQVEELAERLSNQLDTADSIYTVTRSQDQTTQWETIDAFDEPGDPGVLLGTGNLLGEGVDVQHAAVAINMATGSVNPELVQRIGRVLRNPEAGKPKHAMFYNVVSVPSSGTAAIPREDGKRLIEDATAFCQFGARFDMLPGFATSDAVDPEVLTALLQAGAEFIDNLDTDGAYDWTVNDTESQHLRALHSAVETHGPDLDAVLGAWEEYAWEHGTSEDTDAETAEQPEGFDPDSTGSRTDTETGSSTPDRVSSADQNESEGDGSAPKDDSPRSGETVGSSVIDTIKGWFSR